MSSEEGLAQFRSWVLGTLALLSADPSRQVEYLHRSGVNNDELVLQLDDLLHVARARLADGSMTAAEAELLTTLKVALDSLNEGPDSVWETAALSFAPQWSSVREAARRAESVFRQMWA